MRCPECHTDNPEGARFCIECAHPIDIRCPKCGAANPARAKFCMACGHQLADRPVDPAPKQSSVVMESPAARIDGKGHPEGARPLVEGERKHVTVLFSDLSGYTAMSEHLDPEEVKEIISRIFSQIKSVITKYDGFIEKFAGDAVLAIFGVPRAHEDDAVRAVRAAREIHDRVDTISSGLAEKIGHPLSMHSGINTGLVVTGKIDRDKGTHGLSGDTLNVASRLSALAGSREILVGQATRRGSEAYFAFESLKPTLVKGRQEPVPIFKLLGSKDEPIVTRRSSGLSSELIGREAELSILQGAFESLKLGKGTILSIVGDTGTGKSRLVDDFRSSLDREKVQWLQGHAYSYAQSTPYFPLIDLLNRTLQIEERDPPEKVRRKIEKGIQLLSEGREDLVPYIGRLYAFDYPELAPISPELWKSNLQNAVCVVVSGLTRSRPTIVCLEDLQWSDPSTLDLLRFLLTSINDPALLICTYRPPFNLFTSDQLGGLGKTYREIPLHDLSASEARGMVQSMLKTDHIPAALQTFIQEKLEGNPFYMEEVISALVESGTLVRENSGWKLTQPIAEIKVSSTLYGVVFGRLDRLEGETKRILQEASVIGRAFLYGILKMVSELKGSIDRSLSTLERLDLIGARAFHPDLEYFFKHAMTHEAVYSGLLKTDRQDIHERVGRVMEKAFKERLPEHYEILAYHFSQGRSVQKAIQYLVKSGEKSLERYSVAEAHQFYRKAFEILAARSDKSKEEEAILIDLLNSWGYVYYFLGDFKAFSRLFNENRPLAESIGDDAKLGMFYVWLGIAEFMSGRAKDAYDYLTTAIDLGRKCGSPKIEGYAHTWLSWSCAELGRFEEGLAHGERAQQIAGDFPADQYLFFKSMAGMAYVYAFMGLPQKAQECGRVLLEHGKRYANSRSTVMGHFAMSMGYVMAGNFKACIASSQQAIALSKDPFYSQFPRIAMNLALAMDNQMTKILESQRDLINFCERYEIGELLTYGNIIRGASLVAGGQMDQGLKMIETCRKASTEQHRRTPNVIAEFVLGMIYSQIATGPTPNLSMMARNAGFLIKTVPFAGKRAEEHYKKAIELSEAIGAQGYRGMACLQLGQLYQKKKKTGPARRYIASAVEIFEACDAAIYLQQAREALASVVHEADEKIGVDQD
jgi:class 3 adenylate cyclase/tetratricopeptide (TPR) repeat protein